MQYVSLSFIEMFRNLPEMKPEINPAIIESLSLDPRATTLASHGGSGFSSTFKLTSEDGDGLGKSFFVKIGKGKDSEIMFAGTSLLLLPPSKDL